MVRKAIKDRIEGHDSKVEHIYVKYPREELEDITLSSTESSALEDEQKLLKFIERKEIKRPGELPKYSRYTHLHNHPKRKTEVNDEALPSTEDINRFLGDNTVKTLVIAQQDMESGKVEGYLFLRKRKNRIEQESKYEHKRHLDRREMNRYTHTSKEDPVQALKNLAKENDLQYRWIPSKGYELPSERRSEEGWRFVRKGIDKYLAVFMISTFLLSLTLVFYPSITGNIIGELSSTGVQAAGVVLLFVCGLLASAYFRLLNKI